MDNTIKSSFNGARTSSGFGSFTKALQMLRPTKNNIEEKDGGSYRSTTFGKRMSHVHHKIVGNGQRKLNAVQLYDSQEMV